MLTEIICNAIKSKNLLGFRYKGEMRRVEPHFLGENTKGHVVLSAWQVEGGSGQAWRAFEISLMAEVRTLDEKFVQVRPGYNPNGSTMSRILCRI